MRKIPIVKWIEKDKDGNDVDSDSAFLIKVLFQARDPQKMPKGIDMFRMFNRIGKACEKSVKSGFIELEEADYAQVKKAVEEDTPANWAFMEKVNEAIELIVNAELVK